MINKLINTLFKYSLMIITFIITGLISGLIVINIVIKSGNVIVPSLTNKPLDQALIILGQNNLYPIVEGTRYDNNIPIYHIISQKPQPGKTIKKGRTVKIIISKGPRILLIPNLFGKSLREIELSLTEKQLRIGDILKVHSNIYPEGSCIAQEPQSDEKGSPGDSVNILISLGKKETSFFMPNLINIKEEKALEILNKIKVNIGEIKKISAPNQPQDIVFDQDPKPGYPLAHNQVVNLTINKISSKTQPQLLKTFRPFTYKVPEGNENRNIKIIIKNTKGSRELFNKVVKPGKPINLLIEVIGKTYITVFVDGIKTMEEIY